MVCVAPNGKLILSEQLPDATYLELNAELESSAEQLRQANLDILYYWEVGTDSLNYFLPFLKPARVQVGFWGWPVTSGIANMDYYLSCDALEQEDAQQFYTEKLIKLPRLPTYYYRPPVPENDVGRSEFGFTEKQHLYLCAQNLRKVHPDMDEAFKKILLADEAAEILLIEDKRPNITLNLKKRLQKNLGDAATRLHILERMPAEKYLGLVKTADVILDTFHYTGGANTNYDAFAAGTPVVTLPATMHRGRYTTAAYQQMGYLDLVAESLDDYVNKAVALANDKQFRFNASQIVLKGCDEVLEDQGAVNAFVSSVFNMLAKID